MGTQRLRLVSKTAVKRLFIALIVIAVLAFPLVYSTVHGYVTWWFLRWAAVTVNGRSDGFLHRRLDNSAVIITRTDMSPHQSYLVTLSGRKFLIQCGEWSAPRFVAFPIGHVNPPCSVFSNGADDPKADNGIFTTLVVRANSVEFTTISGNRIKASW